MPRQAALRSRSPTQPLYRAPPGSPRRVVFPADFSNHFERVRKQLPQLFADQWASWESRGQHRFRVYSRQGEPAVELWQAPDGSWVGELFIKGAPFLSVREPAIHLALGRLGLL